MNAYGIILQHLFHKGFLTDIAHVVAHKVGGLHTFFHFIGNHVAPVASGESHDECKVAFTIAGKADSKVLFYPQGHIVRVVSCRLSVFVGVDAEQREISCVAGPHPIVRIGAEFADGRRGSAHHTDVTVSSLEKQVVFISAIERFQFRFTAGCQCDALFGKKAVGYHGEVFGRQIIRAARIGIYLQLVVDVIRYVHYFIDVGYGKSFAGKFFVA